MSVKVIKTKDRKPYRPLYYALEEKHFGKDMFFMGRNAAWSDSPFFFYNFSVSDVGTIGSCTEMVITPESSFKDLLAGTAKEHEIKPLQPGEYGLPYLYWPTLIIENRTHAPYLIKSIFGEVA